MNHLNDIGTVVEGPWCGTPSVCVHSQPCVANVRRAEDWAGSRLTPSLQIGRLAIAICDVLVSYPPLNIASGSGALASHVRVVRSRHGIAWQQLGRLESGLPLAKNIPTVRHNLKHPDRNRWMVGTEFEGDSGVTASGWTNEDASVKEKPLGRWVCILQADVVSEPGGESGLSPSLTIMWAWASRLCLLFWEQVIAGSNPAARILKGCV